MGAAQTHNPTNDQTELRIGYYERMGRIMEQMTEDMGAYKNGEPLPRDPRTYLGWLLLDRILWLTLQRVG